MLNIFKRIPYKSYTLFLTLYVAVFIADGGGQFYYFPTLSLLMAYPLPLLLFLQMYFWLSTSLGFAFNVKPKVSFFLLVAFEGFIFAIITYGFDWQMIALFHVSLFLVIIVISFLKEFSKFELSQIIVCSSVSFLLPFALTIQGREFLLITFSNKTAWDDRVIQIKNGTSNMLLIIPRAKFIEGNYHLDPSGNYYKLNVGREVQLVGDFTNPDRIVFFSAEHQLDGISKYSIAKSAEYLGLAHYPRSKTAPYHLNHDVFVPEQDSYDYIFDCWGAEPIEEEGRCIREAKTINQPLIYRYWLEPGELKNWQEIEKNIQESINGFVRK